MRALWLSWDLERVRQLFFDLCYQQHGGSGLNVTWHDVQEMPLSELRWNAYALYDQREAEAKAITKARGGR